MSSNFGFLIPCAAAGHPDKDLCVRNVPFTWPVPSQPNDGPYGCHREWERAKKEQMKDSIKQQMNKYSNSCYDFF